MNLQNIATVIGVVLILGLLAVLSAPGRAHAAFYIKLPASALTATSTLTVSENRSKYFTFPLVVR